MRLIIKYHMERDTEHIKIKPILSVNTLEECSGIFMEAYNGEPWLEDGWTHDAAAQLLTYHFNTPGFMGWIATYNGCPVGCCVGNVEPYYTGDRFVLKEIFVSATSQKMGIGNKLLDAMKASLRARQVKTAILFTHKTLFGFYERSGFLPIAEMGIMMHEKN